MRVDELAAGELRRRLHGEGLRLRTGPVVSNVRSTLPAIEAGLALHYAAHSVEPEDGYADFDVGVARPNGWRRWLKPQVEFRFDGSSPFQPLPGDQGFPLLEWGMNWCLSSTFHRYLVLHCAVLAKGARALLLPAPSGSGKSTLCAALALTGWRLLSDELAVVDPASGELLPVPRPISLKNASIDVIRGFAPGAVFGPVVHETLKGDIAHMRPPEASVAREAERARAAWIVQPRYAAGAPTVLEPVPPGPAFLHLAQSAFNYNVHRAEGFRCLTELVAGCTCYSLSYSDLHDVVGRIDAFAAEREPHAAAAC
jgi:HprK-related kinase A